MEWEPIETAPLGEFILCFDGQNQEIFIAEREGECGVWSHLVAHSAFDEGEYGWPDEDRRIMVGGADGLMANPTHWMPLPAPPAEAVTQK